MKPVNNILIVTHKKCNDGAFAAALVVNCIHKTLQDARYDVLELDYSKDDVEKILSWNKMNNEDLPTIDLKTVHLIFVDYGMNIYRNFIGKFASVTVFDHHALTVDFDDTGVIDNTDHLEIDTDSNQDQRFRNILGKVVVDQNRSGAMQVFEAIKKILGNEMPQIERIISAIDATDRYDSKLMDSDAIALATYLSVHVGQVWHKAYKFLFQDELKDVKHMIEIGNTINDYKHSLVDHMIDTMTCTVVISDEKFDRFVKVKGIWCPYALASITGNKLAKSTLEKPEAGVLLGVAAVICESGKVSMRSVDGCHMTANQIATMFGGGGHKHASGFRCSPSMIRIVG